MLGKLISEARQRAPSGFEDERFTWPPTDLGDGLDRPTGSIQRIDWNGSHIDLEGTNVPDVWDWDETGVKRRGLDVLAWYRSYHFGDSGWGIYITARGAQICGRTLGTGYTSGFWLLYAHEYFHHLADIVATRLEIATKNPIYLPHYRRARSGSDDGSQHWCARSEGLANGYSLARIDEASPRRAVAQWMRRGPAGYRDGPSYLGNSGQPLQRVHRLELAWHYQRDLPQPDMPKPADPDVEIETAFWLADPRDVPLYWVDDLGSALRPATYFISAASVQATDAFMEDIRRLRLSSEWDKVVATLATDAQSRGMRLKKLRGEAGKFSVRLGRDHRAILSLDPTGQFVAEAAAKRSEAYRQ